ncbi:MAG: hypothetical protein SFY69_01065 [Planctomycetota bacterium]|nr:hypothetical protein [Planctomycetota bacterium]
MIESSVWLAVLMALVVVGISMVLRSVAVPLEVRREPTCGGCGYALRNPVWTCPECGARLMSVGVITPRMAIAFRGSTAMLVVGWTMVCAGVGGPISLWVANQARIAAAPRPAPPPAWEWDWIHRYAFVPGPAYRDGADGTATRREKSYEFRLEINTNDDAFNKPKVGIGRLTLVNDGVEKGTLELSYPPAAGVLKDTSGAVVEEFPAIERSIGRRLFEAAGIDLSDPDDAKAAADVGLALQVMFTVQPRSLSTVFVGREHSQKIVVERGEDSQFQVSVPRPGVKPPLTLTPSALPVQATPALIYPAVNLWGMYGPGAGFGLLYVIGLVVLLWRRRRLLASGVRPADERPAAA